MNLLGAVLIVVFGFLFVTVSSRLTGELGSRRTRSPHDRRHPALTSCLFLALGWTGRPTM